MVWRVFIDRYKEVTIGIKKFLEKTYRVFELVRILFTILLNRGTWVVQEQ